MQKKILAPLALLLFASLACEVFGVPLATEPVKTGQAPSHTAENTPTNLSPSPTNSRQATVTPTATITPLPPESGVPNPDEPVDLSGEMPYTSPFFLDTIAEAFVMLEDQGGFVQRNLDFEFPLASQAIGPVELVDEDTVTFSLALPALPQGMQTDLDNDSESDAGVQVFAVAYWSNTWGGPFLEFRDGTGWSNAYASTTTDADRDNEIDGGVLLVWAPDDAQGFPSGFGPDHMLFTADDPSAPIPAGYTLVNLDEEPFRFYKEPHPRLTLYEGDSAVNDFSDLSYAEAFEALFQKVSREYPFSVEKKIDWQALHSEYAERMALVGNDEQFFLALKDFSMEFPDEHVGISFNDVAGNLFFEEYGGSFGMILTELSDGRVLATAVLPGLPAAEAGLRVGAEILAWGGVPIDQAIAAVEPFFGPYSTEHAKRLGQLIFLTRLPPDEAVAVTFENPGETQPTTVEMQAEAEYESLIQAIPSFSADELALPIEAQLVAGLGYIKINTFSDDLNLMAQLWDRHLTTLIDLGVPGLILDLRVNGGGNSGLARDFAGYFYEEETALMKRSYYNDLTGQFEYQEYLSRVLPAPLIYEGPVAVLVSPYCVSACEGFAYSLSLLDNVTIVGHAPSAGAYGEVGRGQYDLPADVSMQFPTGRTETPEGELLIEGVGILPDILVPVTAESALGQVDAVLEAAIAALTE